MHPCSWLISLFLHNDPLVTLTAKPGGCPVQFQEHAPERIIRTPIQTPPQSGSNTSEEELKEELKQLQKKISVLETRVDALSKSRSQPSVQRHILKCTLFSRTALETDIPLGGEAGCEHHGRFSSHGRTWLVFGISGGRMHFRQEHPTWIFGGHTGIRQDVDDAGVWSIDPGITMDLEFIDVPQETSGRAKRAIYLGPYLGITRELGHWFHSTLDVGLGFGTGERPGLLLLPWITLGMGVNISTVD